MYDVKLSPGEKLSLVGIAARLPFRLIYLIIFSPFLARTQNKSLKRAIAEAIPSFLITHASVPQVQNFLGPSTDRYSAWAKKRSFEPVIEDVSGSSAKLIWLTEKRTDRVLFYTHGGGFMTTHTDNMIAYCPGLRDAHLKETGGKGDFGIVALVYTLYPATFPTQLTEYTLALTQLISSGVSAENIIVIGDSAGGNLITQLIMHTLQPVPDVPPSPLGLISGLEAPRRLGGAVLVSPWISLGSPTPSYARNNKYDWVSSPAFTHWGKLYTKDVQPSQISYINPSSASLFKGIENAVARLLITAGTHECLLDDAIGLKGMLDELKIPRDQLDVTLDIQEGGVHEDPILDVETPQKPRGGLSDATMTQVKWIGETFAAASSN